MSSHSRFVAAHIQSHMFKSQLSFPILIEVFSSFLCEQFYKHLVHLKKLILQ